jgi:hypothetical protein
VNVPVPIDGRTHVPTVVVDSIDHPQHLFTDGTRVLVTDHGGSRVVAIAP